jgi:hypothetical protein
LVIAVSAFGIREGFRVRGKIDMQRTQSQFQALQKFVELSFFTASAVCRYVRIDAVICWNHVDAVLATRRLQRLVKFEPATS